MFDWNEEEEVTGIIWEGTNEIGDHIVPCPEGGKDDTPLIVDEHHKKQRHEQASTRLSIAEGRKSLSKHDFPGSNSDSNSNFNTNEDLSAPRFDMDPWPDLPSLNSAFDKGYMDRNHLHSMPSKFINSCTESPDVDTITEKMVTELCDSDGHIQHRELSFKDSCSLPASALLQLDTVPDIFSNDLGDEEGGSFLNCDWANIADFDDLDRIFRHNGSIFGHETIDNADELLSPPTDSISAINPPFSVPVYEQSGGEKIKALVEDKMRDNASATSRQIECHSQLSYHDALDHTSDKAYREKKLTKSRKKLENNRAKLSQNSSGWPSNMCNVQQSERMKMQAPHVSSQSFQSAAFCQQKGGGHVYMGFFDSASQHLLPEYSCPTHSFPAVPLPSPAHSEGKENHPVPPSSTVCIESSKHASESQSKSPTMTPQEKIEKLRRLQKMQAMLAIQHQQEQLGKQSTFNEVSVSQTSSQVNKSSGAAVSSLKVDEATKASMTSSELNMPQGIDDPHKNSVLIDDSLGETVFYQLQDAIIKLDIGIRLCIRDSLFRLSRSALERQNASDRGSTNKSSIDEVAVFVNGETRIQDRSTGLLTETGTNPIDRTVAHLLFYRPSESSADANDEVPPLSGEPDSKWSNTCNSVPEGKTEDAEQLEIKPTLK